MKVTRCVSPLLLLVLISVFDQGSPGPALFGLFGNHKYEPKVQQYVSEEIDSAQQYVSEEHVESAQQSAKDNSDSAQQYVSEEHVESAQQSAEDNSEPAQQYVSEEHVESAQQSAEDDSVESTQQSAKDDSVESAQQSAEDNSEPAQQSASEDHEPAQHNTNDDNDNLLYPYGPAEGDNKTPIEDDGTSGEVPLSVTFKFFGKEYKSLFVNNNGVISFNNAVSQYTPDPFPLTGGETFVTPFWGDVDNSLGGVVYYRETTDPDILQRITRDMAKHLPLKHYVAAWAFIATWDKVAYYGAASKKVNTFQAVLTSDGYHYFAILNYGDIQWTTGTASDGDALTGLGGTPAQAGFNSGDDTHYFNIPGSRTAEVLKIKSTSNVDYPGRWVFEVDDFKVLGGCSFQAQFAREGEEFWRESTCDTKCTCHDGRVCCEDEPCPKNSTCEASGSFFACKLKQKVCS